MFRRHALSVISVLLVASPGLRASTVTSTTTQGGTEASPTTIVTITLTPEGEESIKDFHIFPTAPKKKIPGSATYTQPSGWGSPTGTGSNDKGKHWKASATGDAIPSPGRTFKITVPGGIGSQTFSRFSWTTSSDAETATPGEGDTGYVDSGDTTTATAGGELPVVSLALIGPTTVAIGTSTNFRVSAGLDASQTLGYTLRATRSLESGNLGRVNANDPLPDARGVDLSTNSRTGTTRTGEGARTATLFGDMRNYVIVDVPDDPTLVGEQFYLQVELADGDFTAPIQVTIAGE